MDARPLIGPGAQSPSVKRVLVPVLLAVVATACGGDGDAGGATGTGSTGPGPTTSATTTASTTTPTGSTGELAHVQTAFCQDYLPLLAFTVDVGIVTGGDAIGAKNEAAVLTLVDESRTVLRRTKTLMAIYADSFAELGDQQASDAAAATASVAEEIVNAPDGQTLAAAIDPATLDPVLPTDYCQPFISQGFGRGYFDGWLLQPRDSDDPGYVRGYRLGRAEGWRADQ
jgi:hypothetical protein